MDHVLLFLRNGCCSWGLLVACWLLLGHQGLAQQDTEFWFVAPEVAQSHGDRPILLGLSSTDRPAEVRIEMPAEPFFSPIIVNLAPNSFRSLDLTTYLNLLENQPANAVLNKGLHITSDVPISAYYHVNHRNNLDIYALKGRQAEGLRFFIPSQTSFRNVHGESVFDLVATQDNTRIEITPSQPIVGHAAGESFTITLDRGQTFSCRAAAGTVGSQLAGSRVVADKPIAITNSDDSIVNQPETGWDLVGDQLVPVKALGTKYVAIRGEAATERVYVTATEDDTELVMNGQNTLRVRLDAGESHYYALRNAASYIESSKPVYVWHMSGYTKEAGGALLPSIGCTGLRQVQFVRPFSQDFSLLLLTRSGDEDGFTLNGQASITADRFQEVPATNGEWVAARIDADLVSVANTNYLSNSKGLFHLGIIIHTGLGSAYGYFSSYSNLSLGSSRSFCAGDSLLLDAGPGKQNYLWSTGDTTQQISVAEGGTYWVRAVFDVCELRDTVEVEAIEFAASLGEDTTLCDYDSLRLDASYPGATYEWEDGSDRATRWVDGAGTYWVRVSKNGCTFSDTINVDETVLPPLSLGPDTLLCAGETIELDASLSEATYLWQDGATQAVRAVQDSGLYWVERRFRRCAQRDSLRVGIRLLQLSSETDTVLCRGDTLTLDARQDGARYRWENGLDSGLRAVWEKGIYTLVIENRCELQQKSWFVSVKDCACQLFVPNVFTPNGDGINDVFWPDMPCVPARFHLQVFDRWGQQVFESRSLNDRWLGQRGDAAASEGVYFWVIQYEDARSAEPTTLKGHVSLLR